MEKFSFHQNGNRDEGKPGNEQGIKTNVKWIKISDKWKKSNYLRNL